MKDLFEILEMVPSVRGWTSIENGPAINRLGEVPAIKQLMDGDRSGLPSWFPSTPLGPLPAARDPFGPIPHAPNNQRPRTNIDPLMAPDQPGLPQWIPSGPMAPSSVGPEPFGPVPDRPRIERPPIDVDPPSRPPEWMFGPPELADALTRSALRHAAGHGGVFNYPDPRSRAVEALSSKLGAHREVVPMRRLVSRLAT
jgi:hypothetical protein